MTKNKKNQLINVERQSDGKKDNCCCKSTKKLEETPSIVEARYTNKCYCWPWPNDYCGCGVRVTKGCGCVPKNLENFLNERNEETTNELFKKCQKQQLYQNYQTQIQIPPKHNNR